MKIYNKVTLRDEIEKRGYNFAYITIVMYEKKGYLKSAGLMPDGKRQIPFYTDKEIDDFIKKLPKLIAKNKIKLIKNKQK